MEGSYLKEHNRRKSKERLNVAIHEAGKMTVDGKGYFSHLEKELEQATESCLAVSNFEERIEEVDTAPSAVFSLTATYRIRSVTAALLQVSCNIQEVEEKVLGIARLCTCTQLFAEGKAESLHSQLEEDHAALRERLTKLEQRDRDNMFAAEQGNAHRTGAGWLACLPAAGQRWACTAVPQGARVSGHGLTECKPHAGIVGDSPFLWRGETGGREADVLLDHICRVLSAYIHEYDAPYLLGCILRRPVNEGRGPYNSMVLWRPQPDGDGGYLSNFEFKVMGGMKEGEGSRGKYERPFFLLPLSVFLPPFIFSPRTLSLFHSSHDLELEIGQVPTVAVRLWAPKDHAIVWPSTLIHRAAENTSEEIRRIVFMYVRRQNSANMVKENISFPAAGLPAPQEWRVADYPGMRLTLRKPVATNPAERWGVEVGAAPSKLDLGILDAKFKAWASHQERLQALRAEELERKLLQTVESVLQRSDKTETEILERVDAMLGHAVE
ncbi:hypothetical protein CYMTET_40350 [Cymbomonas tetramitiformis]|uniref:Uncharacterized protein n=1 Tax=Cymbomonas tetramitiformis TaxID=36881 RepID=A0AAE0F319_9CHLO|nr:hypothetical protein CYMTET_40350 [Cymbomonas tetramitiformis]